MTGPRIAAGLCAVVLSLATISPAQEVYRRDWSDHPGMPRQVYDLTSDDRGFLWLASEEGVHRFDGQEVVPWSSPDTGALHGINRGPENRIVAYMEGGSAYEVGPEGLEIVRGPDGEPFDDLRNADYAGDGSLWVCSDGKLFHRNEQGWAVIDAPAFESKLAFRVRGAPDGGAYVGTFDGDFVRVHPDRTAEIWISGLQGRITRIAVKDERTQAFGLRFTDNHGIYLVEDGKVRPVYKGAEIGRRWTGIVFRDDTLWVTATGEVLRITERGNRVEVLASEQGLETGGEAMVDHEKSLWLTGFRGLFQYPEPDVRLWTRLQGTRAVHRIGSDIYTSRWDGPQRRKQGSGWEEISPPGIHIFDWGGVSPWGHPWFVGVPDVNTPQASSALLEYRNGKWIQHVARGHGVFAGGYATDDSGRFWIAYFNTLWRVDRDGAAPIPVATLPTDRAIISGLFVVGDRVRYVTRHGPYCEGTLGVGGDSLQGAWDCETIDGAGELLSSEIVDGSLWIGTRDRGVLRQTGDGWEEVLGQADLGTPSIRGITLSPQEGVWIVTYLGRVRVVTDAGHPRIVERLGPWIGVPNWMTFNVMEEPDGKLWLSGMTSAIEIPPHARQRPTEPPRVFVTGFKADGLDLDPETSQRLSPRTRRIELSWAAPAYRDPASLRYQVRNDSSGDWLPTNENSFRFVDLGPGDYRIEVRASLDGEAWSQAPADIRFVIRSPLWQRPTTWAGAVALAAIAMLFVQWQRTRQQVRLERQRTEIAMNLHDELGAGLGSIGLLTDLASDESMDPGEGRLVTARVGEISRGLSRSLSDIVWTLRPASAELSGFAQFLRQRASDLLSAGDTAVEFHLPDPVPSIRLDLEVRRELHAIASEILHNAAKHAQASKVSVQLRPDDAGWLLRVEDDGAGFDTEQTAAGMGRESMRKRAERIGARLTTDSSRGEGCTIELRFNPRVEDRR